MEQQWIAALVAASRGGVELVTGALDGLGIEQFEILEDLEGIRQILRETAPYWDYAQEDELAHLKQPGVRVYLRDDAAGNEMLARIYEAIQRLKEEDWGFDPGPMTVAVSRIHEEDWANNWKQYFKPIPVGDKLFILPEWEKCPVPPGRKALTIDPGMTFGTGQHETTALCMALLERAVEPGDRVLDVGCGSGILSIAALLLGAETALGVDIDPASAKISEENALRNGFGRERYRGMAGNAVTDSDTRRAIGTGYDVVCANIVAHVILPLIPHVPGFLKPGGTLVVSGVIEDKEAAVREQLAVWGFRVLETRKQRDWVAMRCALDERGN